MKLPGWLVGIIVTLLVAGGGVLAKAWLFVGKAEATMDNANISIRANAESIRTTATILSNHESRISKLEGKDEARREHPRGSSARED